MGVFPFLGNVEGREYAKIISKLGFLNSNRRGPEKSKSNTRKYFDEFKGAVR